SRPRSAASVPNPKFAHIAASRSFELRVQKGQLQSELLMTVREDAIMRRLIWSVIVALAASPVAAQNTVKIGQIEAQTGANAIYGYMSSQGLALAVDQDNKAGGFKVGDKTYTVELIASDTRGDPKEASIQLKRLLETDRAKFVFGPFLSNVF